MTPELEQAAVEWLDWFGEPASRLDDIEFCENGEAYLGLLLLWPSDSDAAEIVRRESCEKK